MVIEQMTHRHQDRKGMEWLEMDVLDLKFGEEEFDLIIDKGKSHDLTELEPPRRR